MRPHSLRAQAVAGVLLALAPTIDRYPLFQLDPGRSHANRVDYGFNSRGEIGIEGCCDLGQPGVWPRRTGNQYLFNSGFQVSGIIGGSRPANPWAGDTTAALFFDASGLRQHGTGVTAISNAAVPAHMPAWPQAGYIPYGTEGVLFGDALRGRASAGDADAWWLAWEGDPGLNAARPHPLGIVAEHRVMGWNAPRGNEDILYVMVTFYNITSREPSAYAAYRPGLREILVAQAEKFHQLNEEKFAVNLPDGGYVIDPFFASFAADPDVTASAGTNLASVNLPLAMSFAWHRDLPRANGWTFPPDLYSAPFFAGAGFLGMKYLRTLDGGPGIHLYSNHTGGGAFPDPNSAVRAFKYMSGTITPQDGVACNQGDPVVTHICYVGDVTAADVRLMQSSPSVVLPAGGSATMVLAYVHAAPVLLPGWTAADDLLPGNPRRLTDAAQLALGANRVDSVAGFTGFVDDNSNGQVEGHELRAVPRSLLAKAQLAQAMFQHRFLAPAAPVAPDFFLIPGDNAVTVAWRPSQTEQIGDPYFTVANAATMTPSGGGDPVPNPLYDPNYRQFDVEGYRIWRGRRDAPEALTLVAQFDHVGTTFRDYTGQVSNGFPAFGRCAPELGVMTDCAATFDAPSPGVTLTKFVEYDVWSTMRQVATGDRVLLPNGEVQLLAVDSVQINPVDTRLGYADNGVPYAWRDTTVRNDLTYFYAVTAYDLNAINSTGAGRTSLESPVITRRVMPRTTASNVSVHVTTRSFLRGRGMELTDTVLPVIDPVTGRFDKRFPVSEGARFGDIGSVAELVSGETEAVLRLDSMAVLGTTTGNIQATQTRRWFTVRRSDGQESRLSIDQAIPHTTDVAWTDMLLQDAIRADPERVALFKGGSVPSFPVPFTLQSTGLYYTVMQGRACFNRAFGLDASGGCFYNGPRWFSGPNETRAHPTGDNVGAFQNGIMPSRFANAGALNGVRSIYHPAPYDMVPATWRNVFHVLGVFAGGADYRVHWGSGGVIDSVIDISHNVPVPFAPTFGATWGILNADAVPMSATYDQRPSLGYTDVACVEPLRSLQAPPAEQRCTGASVALERTARAGAIAMSGGNNYGTERTTPVAAGSGFLLYLKGHYFLVEMAQGLPGAGTEWVMRDYVGAISGGKGAAGDHGPYTFRKESYWPSPLTAIGVELVATLSGTGEVRPATNTDLAMVHTVPDPYYRREDAEGEGTPEQITFVNLPAEATIRIYSASGLLVRVLSHASATGGGSSHWDLRSRANRGVASGVYFYHVSDPGGSSVVGRLTVVR